MSFTRSRAGLVTSLSSNVATEAAVVVITVPALWESSVRSRLVSGNKPGMVTVQSYTVHTVQLYTRPIEQRWEKYNRSFPAGFNVVCKIRFFAKLSLLFEWNGVNSGLSIY